MEAKSMLAQVIEALEDKKAIDIESIDVQKRCAETDYFVIATGKTDRHLKAMANATSELAHQQGLPFICEGREAAEWMLVDLDSVIVHLFLPHIREEVSLESLWTKTTESKEEAKEEVKDEAKDEVITEIVTE
ncbi:MAG: ribosome silencing factor [Mariprofundaceae bacterium]|nr:ribosome silencing factor [Mariprofundaceae bacterium]